MPRSTRPAPPRRRVAAAIDVGSNSVHLLVAEAGEDSLRPLLDESVLLGLGPIVDREGRLPADATRATIVALREFIGRASALASSSIILVGTEPLRRASNRSVLQADVLRATGLPLHVLSHEAEASLTLLGVTGGRPASESLLVVDIGGGSTELILTTPGGDPVVGVLATGSARLTAALVELDPPSWFEINALRAAARRLVDGLPAGRPKRGVLVGGSSTNLLRALPEPPPSKTIDAAAIQSVFDVLTSRTAAQLVATTGINARRAPQLAAGAALVEALLARYGPGRFEVSDASLREGAILAESLAGEEWPDRLQSIISDGEGA